MSTMQSVGLYLLLSVFGVAAALSLIGTWRQRRAYRAMRRRESER
jgi:hypothetical protein